MHVYKKCAKCAKAIFNFAYRTRLEPISFKCDKNYRTSFIGKIKIIKKKLRIVLSKFEQLGV